MATLTDAAVLERDLDDARRQIEDLRYDLDAIEAEHRSALENLEDEWAEQKLRCRDIASEAHRILGDLAWRATSGDPRAQAVETELRDFLTAVLGLA